MEYTVINGVVHQREITGDRWDKCDKSKVKAILEFYEKHHKSAKRSAAFQKKNVFEPA